MCFAPQRRALFLHLNFQKWTLRCFVPFWLGNVLRATTACTFSTSQLPKVVRSWCVLYILTWKCASRHNGVHFFNIRTSKNGANMWCFVHFHFANVLRATTACTFSTSQLPKVVRQWWWHVEMCFAPQRHATFLSLIWPAGSAPAALASLLFDPPEPKIIGEKQCFATFLPFRASASSFFLPFFLLIFLFSLPSSLLCFSSVHTVGSLTSKLPSIITTYYIIDTYYYGWFPHFLGGNQLCILTIIGNIILVESKIVSHFLCIYILLYIYIIHYYNPISMVFIYIYIFHSTTYYYCCILPIMVTLYYYYYYHYYYYISTIIIITFHYYGYSIDYNPIIQLFQLWWLLLPLSLIIYYSVSHYYPIIITVIYIIFVPFQTAYRLQGPQPIICVAFTVPRRHEESRHRGHGAAGDQVWMDLGMI